LWNKPSECLKEENYKYIPFYILISSRKLWTRGSTGFSVHFTMKRALESDSNSDIPNAKRPRVLTLRDVLRDQLLPELHWNLLCNFQPDELRDELYHLKPEVILRLVSHKKVTVVSREQVSHVSSEMMFQLVKHGMVFPEAVIIKRGYGSSNFDDSIHDRIRREYSMVFCRLCRHEFHHRSNMKVTGSNGISTCTKCVKKYSKSALLLEQEWERIDAQNGSVVSIYHMTLLSRMSHKFRNGKLNQVILRRHRAQFVRCMRYSQR
jgi:hypothetical protein